MRKLKFFVNMIPPAGLAGKMWEPGTAPVSLSSGVDTSPFASMGKDGLHGVATAFSMLCQSSQARESSISNTDFLAVF